MSTSRSAALIVSSTSEKPRFSRAWNRAIAVRLPSTNIVLVTYQHRKRRGARGEAASRSHADGDCLEIAGAVCLNHPLPYEKLAQLSVSVHCRGGDPRSLEVEIIN